MKRTLPGVALCAFLEQWTEFGAGTRGESGRLPLGNSLAMKSMKFQSINVLGTIDWS